jgi:hypothetical protein
MLRAVILLSLLILSCKKENDDFSLVGKWTLLEEYNGNSVLDGCFCWEKASASAQHTVEFRPDGSYVLTPTPVSSAAGCTGIYERTADTLRWNRCGPAVIESKITWQSPYMLLEEKVLGGVYVYKYMREN